MLVTNNTEFFSPILAKLIWTLSLGFLLSLGNVHQTECGTIIVLLHLSYFHSCQKLKSKIHMHSPSFLLSLLYRVAVISVSLLLTAEVVNGPVLFLPYYFENSSYSFMCQMSDEVGGVEMFLLLSASWDFFGTHCKLIVFFRHLVELSDW